MLSSTLQFVINLTTTIRIYLSIFTKNHEKIFLKYTSTGFESNNPTLVLNFLNGGGIQVVTFPTPLTTILETIHIIKVLIVGI